jgi:hypothetical protein
MALLITDIASEDINDVAFVYESTAEGKKSLYLEGIFMMAEHPNKNGRIYRRGILESAINRYTNDYINQKRAYGELGHPNGPTINLDKVCIMHENLKWDGNNVVGKAKVTNTPMGKIVEGLHGDGAWLGMSSRGMGSLGAGANGIMEVKSDFALATAADVVADPSAHKAFVRGILENVDWVYDVAEGSWRAAEFLHTSKIELNNMTIAKINETSINYFGKFLQELARK